MTSNVNSPALATIDALTTQVAINNTLIAQIATDARVAIAGTVTPIGFIPTFTPYVASTPPATLRRVTGVLSFRSDCTTAMQGVPRDWKDSAAIRSPNGKLTALAKNPMGDARITIQNADKPGSAVTIPAPNKAFPLGGLAWSPNNEWLAFSNYILSGGGGTIYITKLDGTGLRKLAEYQGLYDTVAWSPDVKEIAFTSGVVRSARPGGGSSSTYVDSYKIFLLTLSGSGQPEPFADGCAPLWTP